MKFAQVVHMSKSEACVSSVQLNTLWQYYKVSVITCPSEQHHCSLFQGLLCSASPATQKPHTSQTFL